MRYRCAILDDYQAAAAGLADWNSLSDVDVTFFTAPFADAQAAARALKDFHIVGLMRERTPFPRALLAGLPNLRLLMTSGMGNAAIDLAAARDHGVTVCGTGHFGAPAAALAIGLMLELTRRIGFEDARLKAGAPWQVTLGRDLEGMTLGIVGLGRLGRRVAAIAQALGMEVIAWSQNLTPEACRDAGVAYASRTELFARADIVSIHLALSERTRGLIGCDELSRMKPTAYLVNTARGPIVVEDDLVDVLRQRRIAGAGLDVFWTEPLPLDHPLRGLDNVVLTPHLGYVTEQGYRRFYADMVEDIAAWLAGAPIRRIEAE
ncbi:MAG: D-2-hydroxyacid dehydrogenase family protein [Xanthobacteraceae bacterium]|nr:MAG: D-2-hydroxyacid dehydrogenase family protein [Xanthobacteraceae bacterium]